MAGPIPPRQFDFALCPEQIVERDDLPDDYRYILKKSLVVD